jgi:CHASE2 domain-containing sensor protein
MGHHTRWTTRIARRFEAAMAWASFTFITRWGALERGYRRPYAKLALRLKFAFYPLLAVAALGWLGWDWSHVRNLAAAEDAIFDTVIGLRPTEPVPSGKVAVVEIDDCSIEYYRGRGEGGWPWSRQRHAELLDALDRAGVRAVGYDIQFLERSHADPMGDDVLEAMAEGGGGRFVFGSATADATFANAGNTTPVSQAPNAFALAADPAMPGPGLVLLLPYGEAMRAHSALLDVDRGNDGILRDVTLRHAAGDWALPSLALQLASTVSGRPAASYPASIRVNWREHSTLPFASAADLIEGRPVCGDALPKLDGTTVLVGYTASGLNDAKPTPVDATTAGVAIHAEAVEALLAGSAVRMPPAWFKYVFAALLVLFTCFVFWRGEPSWDMDAIFLASNLLLVGVAFVGLSTFGVFFDIFAAIGFVSLVFGLCRSYAATQRGRAVGNDDYRPQFDPDNDRWMALARLRFVPHDDDLDRRETKRRMREYRRRLRGWLYRGAEAVAIEGIVEYKHWLYESLMDINVLMWRGNDRAAVAALAQRELASLREYLAAKDEVLSDDGSVRVASLVSVAVDADESLEDTRMRVCRVLGELLASGDERPLSALDAFSADETPLAAGVRDDECAVGAGPVPRPVPNP